MFYKLKMAVIARTTLVAVIVAIGVTPALAAIDVTSMAMRVFYSARGQAPVWADDRHYDSLLAALRGLSQHGLDPRDYHIDDLIRLRNDPIGRDRIATAAWFDAASDMVWGKLEPQKYQPDWTLSRQVFDLPSHLTEALAQNRVGDSLTRLAPDRRDYQALRAELSRLMSMNPEPIQRIPRGSLIGPHSTDYRVVIVRARLVQLGYLAENTGSQLYDQDLKSAVVAFQTAKGLNPDGLIGSSTIAALNLTLADKIDQLRVNLERLRWLPSDLGRRHVIVNIAGYEVSAVENGQVVSTHAAIVGRYTRKTPVFSDRIQYLVFNPWWETPAKLARLDKLPMFQEDPSQVKKLGFRVLDRQNRPVDPDLIDWSTISADAFPYRLRQEPGRRNALGQVKIMFPNKHAVYLHDTPDRELFSKQNRAISSGCVRTEDALGLSEWLLSETPGWTSERIARAVASGKVTTASLAEPVPVHLLYHTTTIDDYGNVQYLDDVYGRDGAVLAGLRAPPPELRAQN